MGGGFVTGNECRLSSSLYYELKYRPGQNIDTLADKEGMERGEMNHILGIMEMRGYLLSEDDDEQLYAFRRINS